MPDQNHRAKNSILVDLWRCVLPSLTCRQHMLEELTALFQRSLDVLSFDLLVLDQGGQTLHSVASWNAGRSTGQLVLVGETVCGHVAQTGKMLNVPDVAQDPRCAGVPQGRARAELAVPLVIDGKTIAVLDFKRERTGGFSQQDESFFADIAQQVAYALHYTLHESRLREIIDESERRLEDQTKELRAERDRSHFLHQVTQEMTRTLDLDRVLNRTLARVSKALGVKQASILLLDPESGYLNYRAALGRPIVLPKGGKLTRFKSGVGLGGWVLDHNQHAIITDFDNDPRWEVDPEKLGQSQSVMAVPMSTGTEVLGVMMLFHPQPNYFDNNHIGLAMAAANHITAAIKNTELYRLVRDQAARLGQMLRDQRSVASQRMAILASIADGVVVSDESDRIIVVNDAARRLLRLTGQDWTGQHISVLFTGFAVEAQEALLQAIANVATHVGHARSMEPTAVLLTLGGQSIQASFTYMLDDKAHFSGTVLVLRDVTHEQEVAQAKNEFISTVAHEFRTPMTSIKGYTDLLLQGTMGELGEGQRRFLEIVKSNVDRLSSLVGDLLDISRIEAGRIRLDLSDVQMSQLVREVCDSLEETIRERELTLKVNLEPGIPVIQADRNRMIQVLVNLLSNAYRYTPAGGKITVSAQVRNRCIQVDVADTGIGIDEKDLEKIFERFYRADQPVVNEQTGTGLGLPIVRSLVQMHGGRVWVESELEQGSTFSFTLPLQEDDHR